MKRWIAVMATGLGLVAVWLLPPKPPTGGTVGSQALAPMQRRYSELQTELRRADEVLMRRQWSDSLSARLVADAVNGVDVGAPPELPRESLEKYRAKIETELAGLGPDRPKMLLGVYLQPMGFGSALPPQLPYGDEIYAGTRDGQAYCLQVRTRPRIDDRQLNKINGSIFLRDIDQTANPLESCRLYAVYGMPGPHVLEWFRRGGSEFGRMYVGAGANSRVSVRVPSSQAYWTYWFTTRGGAITLDFERCLSGQAAACTRVFERPAGKMRSRSDVPFIYANSPVVAGTGAVAYPNPFREYGALILSDLENQYGRDAFRRFWTSGKDVVSAFTEAFGMEPGAWLVRWTEQQYGLRRAGPSLPRSAWLGSLLAIMACAGIAGAIAVAYRRVN